MNVCFVGNSYTAANGLSTLIARLAADAGQPALHATLRCAGGMTLGQHLAGGETEATIRAGGWDWVVLQDQSQVPSFPPEVLEQRMYPAIRALHRAAQAAGARTLLFQTWGYRAGDRHNRPDDTYAAMQDRVEAGYGAIARELGVPVAPVGAAWRLAVQRCPDIGWWDADGSHPSRAGSYLTAVVLYASLYERTPVGHRYHAGLDADTARVAQEAARMRTIHTNFMSPADRSQNPEVQ